MLLRMVCATLLVLPGIVLAEDWPQWRGPERNGISEETGLLKEWPENGPALTWHIQDVGTGYSTPAIADGVIYLLGNEGTDNEFVQARKAADGELVWQTRIGTVGENRGPQYPGARTTPTVDGDQLYVLGSNGDLACLTRDGGEVVWTKNLRSDFGGTPGAWAYAESPLVDGEKVVCTPGGVEATIVALNKETGETIWKCSLPEGDEAGYSSVVKSDAGGREQYVQFLQKGVVGVDSETGELLWNYAHTAEGSPANIPTPVLRENLVYTASARGGGGLARIEEADKGLKAVEVYHSPKLPNSIGGSVLLDGLLYGTSRQGLMCVEFANGDVKWQDRSVGAASILFADGMLFLHGENNEVALVEPNPSTYEERGRFTPADGPERGNDKAWAYPVVANGKLYIRDGNSLWCYDIAE